MSIGSLSDLRNNWATMRLEQLQTTHSEHIDTIRAIQQAVKSKDSTTLQKIALTQDLFREEIEAFLDAIDS
jgi:hypothetical protein